MSNTDENLRLISEKVKSHSSSMATEEAVKTAVVLPFLRALGYDIFDPSEVIPEFTADAVGKKGEKVDYAIKIDGEIRILIECKPINVTLEKKHLDQLFRYFTVTKARFAILTNGRTFNFYTDLEEPNKLDVRPFLIFDIADIQAGILAELRKFEKNSFDISNILATAERLKYTSGVKQEISRLIEDPTEDFVRMIARNVYEGKMTAPVREMLKGVVRSAFREVITDNVKNRLSTALADTDTSNEAPSEPAADDDSDIVTTDEEREGYMIVKAIAREAISADRIIMRDAKSYCAVLVDNNRKPLARLHFNRSTKYIGLFDGENEDRILIDSLDQIYELSDRIRATAKKYL